MKSIEPKNYIDESTTDVFRFIFRCDSCGKVILDYVVQRKTRFKPRIFNFSKAQIDKKKEWVKEHDQAYNEAKALALEKLNRCEVCGKLVCDECAKESYSLDGGICCKHCIKK